MLGGWEKLDFQAGHGVKSWEVGWDIVGGQNVGPNGKCIGHIG
jgi:hypothetical protein